MYQRQSGCGSSRAWRVDGSAVVECPRQDAYASQQRAPRVFRFDDVFDVRADNTAVYEQVAKDVVDDALRGNSGALIAYGQTASGKTHTMQGTPESPGLIPRAVVDVVNILLFPLSTALAPRREAGVPSPVVRLARSPSFSLRSFASSSVRPRLRQFLGLFHLGDFLRC